MGRFVPAKGFSHEDILSWGLEKGIHQLTQPYFTDELLKIKFGDVWKEIKIEFLDEQGFRYERNKQEDLIAFVAANEKWQPLQDQLLELQSDLIFLKDPQNPEVLHFRINMMETDCFKSLSWSDQQVLREKYYAYFFKDQYASWKADGTKKLNQLQHATSMLICAEDLGMVPDFVEGVLQEKEMLVLQVQRMPKKMGMTFSRPTEASYLSVVTPSTHDMSPLRSWWLEDRALTHKFYHEVMHGVGNEPELCSEEVVRWIINEHLRAPSMWSIFLLQDILSLDEKWWNPDLVSDRINNPADPFHYWNYRMHVSIESLLDDTTFSGSIHKMIAESGRGL
jgi:4-alpha-glucanotransferase